MPFDSRLVVEAPSQGEGEWTLVHDITYYGARHALQIPSGFTTDFASVPQVFQSFVPKTGRLTFAAVVHDWLYETQPDGFTRKDADGLFRRIMREFGVKWWRRRAAYYAVRIGGRRAWKRSKERIDGQRAEEAAERRRVEERREQGQGQQGG